MQPMPQNIKFHPEMLPHGISYLLRDLVSLLIVAMLSVTIKMTGKWYTSEAEKQEEQKERTEAELRNLRKQLNPHFLFNTLNNIYAQIAINPDDAQNSMLELSKLLRYVLYENNGNFVALERELNFIHNYVELMRIRLNPEVDMRINISVNENKSMAIVELKVPSPGESITEVTIARWLKKTGDVVEKDEVLAEIDSDKATLTFDSSIWSFD